MIYGKHGRGSEALEALDTAEKLDPSFDMTYFYRGNVLLSSGDVPGAVAQYQKAISMNPDNKPARDALASATKQLQSPTR
jgi:tetratricopeptide (TPR) repeat protein